MYYILVCTRMILCLKYLVFLSFLTFLKQRECVYACACNCPHNSSLWLLSPYTFPMLQWSWFEVGGNLAFDFSYTVCKAPLRAQCGRPIMHWWCHSWIHGAHSHSAADVKLYHNTSLVCASITNFIYAKNLCCSHLCANKNKLGRSLGHTWLACTVQIWTWMAQAVHLQWNSHWGCIADWMLNIVKGWKSLWTKYKLYIPDSHHW